MCYTITSINFFNGAEIVMAAAAATRREQELYKTPGWDGLGQKIITDGVRQRGLGAGGYGEARIIRYGGQEYVVKTSLPPENTEYTYHRFIKEVEMCEEAARRIPEITSEFIGGKVTNKHATIIFKYIPGMTLAEYLRVPGIDKERLVGDITNAIMRIREAGMEHRDIKLDNIYIEDPYRLVIIDWGLSLMLGDDVPRNDPRRGEQDYSANGSLNARNRNTVIREIRSAVGGPMPPPLRVGPPLAVGTAEVTRAIAPRLNSTRYNEERQNNYNGPIEVVVTQPGGRRKSVRS